MSRFEGSAELATDEDLAAACELERSVYVAGDDALRRAFAPATIARETSRTYEDGQTLYSDGTLTVGAQAPDVDLWTLERADAAELTPTKLLALARASAPGLPRYLVLDFGSFS